jgi:hypothetical protein
VAGTAAAEQARFARTLRSGAYLQDWIPRLRDRRCSASFVRVITPGNRRSETWSAVRGAKFVGTEGSERTRLPDQIQEWIDWPAVPRRAKIQVPITHRTQADQPVSRFSAARWCPPHRPRRGHQVLMLHQVEHGDLVSLPKLALALPEASNDLTISGDPMSLKNSVGALW